MSEKEEDFPFEDFVQLLSEDGDLTLGMKTILKAVCEKNIYWIYSAVSTILQILKSKEEEPAVKCRCMNAIYLLMTTYEYPIISLLEVYILPVLQARKSEQSAAYYFQQVCSIRDSPQVRKQSIQFIERASQIIHLACIFKPYRTVEIEEINQESNFCRVGKLINDIGIKQPTQWKYCEEKVIKNCRKIFLDKLKKFGDQSDGWAEFLLVNLLQQVKSGKRQLLQLRQLIAYGECYLTSPLINVCEDQLGDLNEGFEEKRKYIGLLNELVRSGDIEAVIMIKNSQFFPSICSRIGALQGHLGIVQGETIFPQISASKQIKKQFYCDFLRSLQNWARSMPKDYDSQDFNICAIYTFLKEEKKFKFPDNLNINRYEKEVKQNLIKNKERNDKLVEILQKTTTKHLSISSPFSKQSHVININPTLSAQNLQLKLDEVQKQLKKLSVDAPSASQALKKLTQFKDNWIGYLQALNIEDIDQDHIQTVVNSGQKYVQQIQLIIPLGTAFTKGSLSYKQFRQRVEESLDFHQDVSKASISNSFPNNRNVQSFSKSLIKSKNSIVSKSQFGKSKLQGQSLREKIKEKNRFRSKVYMSKAMDRSNISKLTNKSNLSKHTNKSKFTDKSKYAEINKFQSDNQLNEGSRINEPNMNIPEKSQIQEYQGNRQKSLSQDQFKVQNSKSKLSKYFKQQSIKQKQGSLKYSRLDFKQGKSKISLAKSHQLQIRGPKYIEQYEGMVDNKQQRQQRKSNSSILSRRSLKGSKLSKSKNSILSMQKGVRPNPSKLLKEGSLIELKRTKKASSIQSELKKDIQGINQTIQLNGNIIRQGSITQKKNDSKLKKQDQFNDFKDGHQSISSIIHTNSALKIFQAEKIFNTIKKEGSIRVSNPPSGIRILKPSQVNHNNQVSQGMIISPDLLPMKHSFHQDSKSNINDKYYGDNPQFKQVFANRYQGIQSRQKEEKLLRTNEGLKNIIKSSKSKVMFSKDSMMYQLNTYKAESEKHIQLPPLHSQYGGSYKSSKDLQYMALQEKKNKQIQYLRGKIKQLEQQTMSMRTQLVAKDNELKSIKSGSLVGSERGFAHFTSPTHSNYDKTSLSKSQKGSLRANSTKRGEMSLFEKNVQNGFKQFLQKITGTTFRKSLLKQKCLIHKSDQIQIGCLSQSGETVLESTLYITSHRFDLLNFSITILHDVNLKIKTFPEKVKVIKMKRQQKIHLTIEVLGLPFCLPQLQINYKPNSQYSSNYLRLTLPLPFNKFCEISSITGLDHQPQNHILYVRTDDFKLNQKIVKLDKLSDFFSSYTIIPPNKERDCWLAFARIKFSQSIFNICISFGEKNSWIEGFLISGDSKPMSFFICTNKQILDANKK